MCPEAQHLLSRYYRATSAYADRAKRLRPAAVALLSSGQESSTFDAARSQAAATRRACEKARADLHFHVTTHGC